MNVEQFLELVRSSGWADYVGKEGIAALEKAAAGLVDTHADHLYLALSMGGFDAEYIEDEDSYPFILGAYKDASGGVFAPADVTSTIRDESEEIDVAFRLSGKEFSVTVPFEGDYFEEGVHDLVNEALAETGAPARFFMLPDVDQCVNLVFVPPALYKKAQDCGLIPSSQQEPPEDEETGEALMAAIQRFRTGGEEDSVQGALEMVRLLGGTIDQSELDKIAEAGREREKKK